MFLCVVDQIITQMWFFCQPVSILAKLGQVLHPTFQGLAVLCFVCLVHNLLKYCLWLGSWLNLSSFRLILALLLLQIELIRRDYVANGGWETFLSYEDPEQDIFFPFLHLLNMTMY